MSDCKYDRTGDSGRRCDNNRECDKRKDFDHDCDKHKDCDRDCTNGSTDCGTNFREAVCIHTDKIYDSCRDKDCASYK